MARTSLAFVLALGALLTFAGRALAEGDTCRKEYVVPYAEQCGYAYGTLKKDRSRQNLAAAFAACARAQDVAVSCVKNDDRNFHAVALGALYRDVTQQAEIAMFAQQFTVAEALLREKLQVLDIVAADAKRNDPKIATERASTGVDIKDAIAGQCMVRSTATAPQQRAFARAHKYSELETLLKEKSRDYGTCARLATSPAKRAYIEYVGLVAVEESGRAAQAAGGTGDAKELYAICTAGAGHASSYANAPVKALLKTVAALCTGRANGTYRVDQPEPLDADDGTVFKPLRLPKS